MILLHEVRVGAMLQQQTHHGNVAEPGGTDERRRPFVQHSIADGVLPLQQRLRQRGIRVGADGKQLLDHVQRFEPA